MVKKMVAVLILLALSAGLFYNSIKTERYEAEFLRLFDTMTKIVSYTKNEKEFNRQVQFIYDNLKEYHELYDIYHNYEGKNNIKTINDNAGLMPVRVDKKIIDLLLFSKDIYDKTDSKVNVALGSVLKIWHDYRTAGIENPQNAMLPPLEKLRAAAAHTDIDNIIINQEESTVFLTDPDMLLDVGSVGKGFALEQVCKMAIQNGLDSAIVSVGGNVRAIGTKAENRGLWNVGIQNPDKESDQANLEIVYIHNLSVVTSGDYQRSYTIDGKQYHHIIDPDTLFPAEYFASVTILCEDSGMADALSTAVFNMPFEQGLKLIDQLPETEAYWVFPNGETRQSASFENYLIQNR